MSQRAWLRLIRYRFIAGHNSSELRCATGDPIRNIVDRCRVWESHADSEIRRVCKPGPKPVFPTYVVSESDKGVDDPRVAAVTIPQSTADQVKKYFLRLLPGGGGGCSTDHRSPGRSCCMD